MKATSHYIHLHITKSQVIENEALWRRCQDPSPDLRQRSYRSYFCSTELRERTAGRPSSAAIDASAHKALNNSRLNSDFRVDHVGSLAAATASPTFRSGSSTAGHDWRRQNAAVPRLNEEMHTRGVAVNLNDLAFQLFTSAEVHVLLRQRSRESAVSCSRVVQRGGSAKGRWERLSNSADRISILC
jgi:hypothetical protein